jgi:hypothetical protein
MYQIACFQSDSHSVVRWKVNPMGNVKPFSRYLIYDAFKRKSKLYTPYVILNILVKLAISLFHNLTSKLFLNCSLYSECHFLSLQFCNYISAI